MANKLVHQSRKGLVSASLFERDVKGANGSFKSQSVALNIIYKKDDEFKTNTISIIKQNLDAVIEVLNSVKEKIRD